MSEIVLVSAMALNRVIGIDNTLPWHLPADFAHFKAVTMNKPVIMGRATFQSIGRPLPGRRNIVLSRDASFHAEGCERVSSVDEALMATADSPEVMIIGGAQVYQQFLPLAHRLELTEVQINAEGDALFPEFDDGSWLLKRVDSHPADDKNSHAMRFLTYVKN